jgi:hypothetical protein
MKWPAAISVSVVSLTSFFYGIVPAKAPAPAWFSVGRNSLCVTEGVIKEAEGNRLSVDVPKMRAYVNRWTAQAIEARFTYLGPTAVQAPLASGEIRRQFGLKLRAQDGCNLIYTMWRFEPESKLVVSLKSNPNEHISAECGNRGYRNIKARKVSPVPLLHPGDIHTVRAEMNAAEMAVFVDGTLVWEGNLGPETISSDGPVGIRSDNARLDLEVRARQSDGVHPDYVLGCKSDAGESD